MIAMKREVAVLQKKDKQGQVFRSMKQRVSFSRHTRESVQSPLVVLKSKVRKGGDFFYGKSSNENHFESV